MLFVCLLSDAQNIEAFQFDINKVSITVAISRYKKLRKMIYHSYGFHVTIFHTSLRFDQNGIHRIRLLWFSNKTNK
jgi:hypothetical protein